MRRTGPPVPGNDDDTELIEALLPESSDPGEEESLVKKIDNAGPIIATAVVFTIVGAFVISFAIWGLVSVWRAIL